MKKIRDDGWFCVSLFDLCFCRFFCTKHVCVYSKEHTGFIYLIYQKCAANARCDGWGFHPGFLSRGHQTNMPVKEIPGRRVQMECQPLLGNDEMEYQGLSWVISLWGRGRCLGFLVWRRKIIIKGLLGRLGRGDLHEQVEGSGQRLRLGQAHSLAGWRWFL